MTLIRYQCWNCGSEKTVEEELARGIPEINRWDICEECQNERNID